MEARGLVSAVNESFEHEDRSVLLGLVSIYSFFVFARFAIALFFQDPWIQSDELLYKTFAQLFFKSGSIHQIYATHVPGLPRRDVTNILYPLLLSPSFFFGDNFYVFMKLINSVTMNLAVFPVFFITREFASPRASLLASTFVLLMPSFNFITNAMAENLFLPIFLLCFYYAYRALVTSRLRDYIFLTLFMIAGYFTKPHIVAFVAAFSVTSCLIPLVRQRGESLRVMIWLRSLLVVFLFAVSVYMINSFMLKNTSVVGFYKDLVVTDALNQVDFMNLSCMTLSNITSFLFVYLLPVMVSFWALSEFARERKRKELAFLLLSTLSFLSFLSMATIFAVQISTYEKINARLYFYAYPFFIISFVAFARKVTWSPSRRLVLLLVFVASMAVNIFVAFPTYADTPLISSNMDFAWLIVAVKRNLFILAYIPCFLTVLYYLLRSKKSLTPYLLFFLLTALAANIAHGYVAKAFHDGVSEMSRTCRDLLRSSNLEGRVMLVNRDEAAGYAIPFWVDYDYNEVVPNLPPRTTITREMVPENTDWVVLSGEFRLGFPSLPLLYGRNDCRIVSLGTVNIMNRIEGLYEDGWTKKEFYFQPGVTFENMVITLTSWQPSYPNTLTVEMEGKTELFQLRPGISEITLPFSNRYSFRLKRAFVPRERKINDDARELGIHLSSAYIK